MKRHTAAVLGLALTISLAPASTAQSLNFGSVGSNDAPAPVAGGYPYMVFEWGHFPPLDDWHLCEIGINLNLMVETDGPGAGVGYLGATDTATGRTVTNDLDTRFSSDVYVFNYLDDTQSDWLGTTREFEMFVIDLTTQKKRPLGALTATIPTECTTGQGRVELATGNLSP